MWRRDDTTLQVDDALEFMKDEYNTRMDNCDQREVSYNAYMVM